MGHTLSVAIINEQSIIDIPDDLQFSQWANEAYLQAESAVVNIKVVDAEESAALNGTYRGKAQPTNVLSFPMDFPEVAGENCLGDLAICAAVVKKEALEQHKSSESHWAHMVIHGILHLQGYDHLNEHDAEAMETIESDIMTALGYGNPYIDANQTG